MNGKSLEKMESIASLMLDKRLADLERAARARQESIDLLRGLEVPAADDIDPLLAARLSLRYQIWADGRRAEINLALARQTADWTMKRDTAQQAFARSEALRLLKQKHA